MATKSVAVTGIGTINLYKRKGNTSIRLSFGSGGEVRVSLPYWMPYQAGVDFARTKADWIIKHQPKPTSALCDGDRIGKAHTIQFERGDDTTTPRASLKGNFITVRIPYGMPVIDPEAQRAAERGAKKALQKEAERLLPQRLQFYADEHQLPYRSVEVKQLKTRWGSCSNHKDITLNYYLMQLPWKLIDYVLLHELTHTKHMNHGPDFWALFDYLLPGAKTIKRELREHQTAVVPGRI